MSRGEVDGYFVRSEDGLVRKNTQLVAPLAICSRLSDVGLVKIAATSMGERGAGDDSSSPDQ